MASTWSITLSCGHAYELQSGTPDLKTPYICGAWGDWRDPCGCLIDGCPCEVEWEHT